tara:strand:- start:451 stop:696 length:246 start_codon:yes stop_codon:yes gene_type:complete
LQEYIKDLENKANILSSNFITISKKIDTLKNTLKYFKDNKEQTLVDILSTNNTVMPDFMENGIMENVYNYLIEKIEVLVKA